MLPVISILAGTLLGVALTGLGLRVVLRFLEPRGLERVKKTPNHS